MDGSTLFFICLLSMPIIGIIIAQAKKEKEIIKQRELDAAREVAYKELEFTVLKSLNLSNWSVIPSCDEYVTVKSRQALENYDDIKFFKDNPEKIAVAQNVLEQREKTLTALRNFLNDNPYKHHEQYLRLESKIKSILETKCVYKVRVAYVSSAGNTLDAGYLSLTKQRIKVFENDPTLLMSKGELSKYQKEQQKEALNQKHHQYYDRVNNIIDFSNENRDMLFIKGSAEQLDNLMAQLFDRTVNSIKKIKSIDSDEWDVIEPFISRIDEDAKSIVNKNQKILDYYNSPDFLKLKETCDVLMTSQREFNEYITEKVESITHLFGSRVVRNETINDDEYQYIRPYKKTITPFVAEVSATVFASAENNPLEYVVKNFYPNKERYPEQIQKLHLLIEELSTLKEAKQIIDTHKNEYQQYLQDVPDYILQDDESGFYSRLGFANVDESALVVEYKFSYTSGAGMAKRSFTVPMTEETIVELIRLLEGKLTVNAFTKEQRALMTGKLRDFIKSRDNFTCCSCGNSTHVEPNLLLEIDHIVPVSKGGYTIEENLQTLCWKCNRSKSDKLIYK